MVTYDYPNFRRYKISLLYFEAVECSQLDYIMYVRLTRTNRGVQFKHVALIFYEHLQPGVVPIPKLSLDMQY